MEGAISSDTCLKLEKGVHIKLKSGIYKTKPCKVRILESPMIEERNPPIRIRKNIPTQWIEICITEGKNRQIRKMCAVVGYPCLRLIRKKIASVEFHDVGLGEYRTVTKDELKKLFNEY